MGMKGTRIQVSHPGGAAKGIQLEGIINTGRTPKPGTVMEMLATAPVSYTHLTLPTILLV